MAGAAVEDPSEEHLIRELFRALLAEVSADDLDKLLPARYVHPAPRHIARHLLGNLDPQRVNVARILHRRRRGLRGHDLNDLATLLWDGIVTGPRRLALCPPPDAPVRPSRAAVLRAVDETAADLGVAATRLLLAAMLLKSSATNPVALELLRTDERLAHPAAASLPKSIAACNDDAEEFDPYRAHEEHVASAGDESPAGVDTHDSFDDDRSLASSTAVQQAVSELRAALADSRGDDAVAALELIFLALPELLSDVASALESDHLPSTGDLDAIADASRAVADLQAVHGLTDGPIATLLDIVEDRRVDWTAPVAAALLRCTWASANAPFTAVVADLAQHAHELLEELLPDAQRPSAARAPVVGPQDVDEPLRPYVALVQAVDAKAAADDVRLQREGLALAYHGGRWAELAAAAMLGALSLPDEAPALVPGDAVDAAPHTTQNAADDTNALRDASSIAAEAPGNGTDVAPRSAGSDRADGPRIAEETSGDRDVPEVVEPGIDDDAVALPAAAKHHGAQAAVSRRDIGADGAAGVAHATTGMQVDTTRDTEHDARADDPDNVAEATDDAAVAAGITGDDETGESAEEGAAELALAADDGADDVTAHDVTEEHATAEPGVAVDNDPALAAAIDAGLLDLLAWEGRRRGDEALEAAGRLIALGAELRSSSGEIAAAYYDAGVDFDDSVLLHRSVALLTWATALRVAVLAPSLHHGQSIATAAAEILDHPAVVEITRLVAVAAWADEALTPDRIDAARGHVGAEEAIAAASEAARHAAEQLTHQRFAHVGTTRVWAEILADSASPVRWVLDAAGNDRREDVAAVASMVRDLRRPAAVDDLARRYDRRPAGEVPIHTRGREWLRRRINDAADRAAEWLEAVTAGSDAAADAPHLQEVIRHATEHGAALLAWLDAEMRTGTATAAAAARAARRLTNQTLELLAGNPLATVEPPAAEALGVSLLRCPGVVVDDFSPLDPVEVTSTSIASAAVATWRAAFDRHAVAGNLTAAQTCARRAGDTIPTGNLAALYAEARRSYQRDYTVTLTRYRRESFLAALGSERAVDIDRRLATIDPAVLPDDANIAAADWHLRRIVADLEAALGRHADALHAELSALLDPAQPTKLRDVARAAAPQIRAEIVENRLAVAQQMLHAVRRGERPQSPPAQQLRLEALRRRLEGIDGDPLEAAVPADASPDTVDAARRAVQAWAELREWPRDARELSSVVRRILALLGVTVDATAIATPTDVRAGGSHQWREVTPAAVTRSPAERHFDLHTDIGRRWRVLAVRNAPDVDRLSQLIADDRSGGPLMVLYDGTLGLPPRRQLATTLRDTAAGRAVIVIDAAVVADLAASGELRDFEAVAERALPFADVNPYAPDGRESLPEVLFYGRDAEIRQLVDPYGSLFVYGGRQLGKSALLTQTGREFMRASPGNIAVRIDVRSHGVELQRHTTMYILQLIAGALAEAGLSISIDRDDPVTSLRRSLNEWLDGNPDGPPRAVLVLLDECDAFLDLDYHQVDFPAVTALKSLMEQTNRRFKPIFAGLHQVQRFARATNQPFMHFGRPVRVGILEPAVAPQLLIEPLHRIGYRFDDPQLVWQILQEANYQPGILQAIGRTLVEQLSARPLGDGEPPYHISAADVDGALSDPQTVGEIRTRFRNTVELDDRYKVIAALMCHLASEEGMDVTFDAAKLRADCLSYWREGFEGDPDEFTALLEEMVGLGVLAHDPANTERYLLFSPKIVSLLGGADKVLETLLTTAALDTRQRFAAKDERRVIDRNEGVFSPLSEQVLSQLTSPRNRVVVVAGTEALGLTHVQRTLRTVADAQYGTPTFTVTSTPAQRAKVAARLPQPNPGAHRIHVIDLGSAGDGVVGDIVALAERHIAGRGERDGTLCVVLLAGRPQSRVWHKRLDDPAAPPSDLVVLRRFDAPTLRLWRHLQDIAADAEQFVVDTAAATGGWPSLLGIAWRQWNRTSQWSEGLAAARAAWDDPQVAGPLLEAAGLDDEAVTGLYAALLPYDGHDDIAVDDLVAVFDGEAGCDDVTVRTRLIDLHVAGAIDLTHRRLQFDPVLRELYLRHGQRQ